MTDNVKIVNWSTGTEEEIAAMLNAHYAGEINIADYWSVGDTRSGVSLASIASGTTGEVQPAQDIELTIIGINHDDLETSEGSISKAAITVQTKNCLSKDGYMNANFGGPGLALWSTCNRRIWCNNEFKNALPTWLSNLIKPVTKLFNRYCHSGYSNYNSYRTHDTVTDSVFLLSEYEIFGTNYFSSYYGTLDPDGTQYEYMKTQSNRIKTRNGSNEFWFSRTGFVNGSGYSYFRGVDTDGSYYGSNASGSYGVAPGFCL